MTERTRQIQAIVEAGMIGLLGIKFFYLVFQKQIFFYIHPRLFWVLCVGWFLILVFSCSQLMFRSVHTHTRWPFFLVECVVGLGLLVLPVKALDASNKILLTSSAITQEQVTDKTLPTDTEAYAFADWYSYFVSGRPRPELEGKRFHASGFLAESNPNDASFELGRVVITCCAADGYLTSFTIHPNTADSTSTHLVSDDWYDVTGVWHVDRVGRWFVQADSIVATGTAFDPYVYP